MAVVIVLAVWAFLIASVGVYRYVTGTIELSVNRFRNQLLVLERTRTTLAITSNGTTVTATKSKERVKMAQSQSVRSFSVPSTSIHRRRQILGLLVATFVMTTVVSLIVSALALLSLISLSLLGGYVLALFVTAGLRESSVRGRSVQGASVNNLRRGQFIQPQIQVDNDSYYGSFTDARVANYR
ncbi:MAG: hypothetical protein M0Z45_04045 [Actinomycetota bacterium]|nr:hypothetical protein [Actinomycetota bacterium]